MPRQTVLIIRHAEKPVADGDDGIASDGSPDRRSLTPRGWQRAGVWVEIFAPSLDTAPVLPKPTAIFASSPATGTEIASGRDGSKSRRPLETVTPLAAKLGLQIDLRFGKGKEIDLAATISRTKGVVLVCWQHENIAAIAKALAPKVARIPDGWPGTCFNVVFKLVRADQSAPWSFEQVVPRMLSGDRSQPISGRGV